MTNAHVKSALSARITDYKIPPVKDALVLGRESPIGCLAMRRALSLLIKAPYAHVELDDDTVSDILVRESLLKRLPQEQLINFVLSQIKPIMAADEVLHLELDVEVIVSGGGT